MDGVTMWLLLHRQLCWLLPSALNRRMSLDPLEVYGRYVQRQQHEDQFSEDVRKVIHTGVIPLRPPPNPQRIKMGQQ
eukprot:5439579-Amphidinium_carterae.1